jgi:transposase
MDILEAFDLTGSLRAAADLAGCDHKTVARYVRLRDAGQGPDERQRRPRVIDPFLDKIVELVERSGGRIRASEVHRRITTMGFTGVERTTRQAVAEVKREFRAGQRRRVFRPWTPEPGCWLQYDWGEGPRIAGRRTYLWCAWLAWSRYRVVIPTWDRSLPTVIGCLDATLRRLGGAPTYVLTDNEKTVTVDHIAGLAVRHPELVAAARHYGVTIKTCVPADPQTKGGVERTVQVVKRDLVSTELNLLGDYDCFADLEAACAVFGTEVNARRHAVTRRPPVEMLAVERAHLHQIPDRPFSAVFGETRRVSWDSTISVAGARYSVPHQFVDDRVWVRFGGDELIVTAVGESGPAEIARHQRAHPGNPSIHDEHYPPRTVGPDRLPRPGTAAEAAFLAIGEGAVQWLTEATALGVKRIRVVMAQAVTLAKLHGNQPVDRALGIAALAGRFAEGDLESILAHHQQHNTSGEPTRASEDHSLQSGTSAWFRVTPPANPTVEEGDRA